MNIDRQIVNRAMEKAGEEGITEQEWLDGKSNRVRLVKDVYLASILEALSQTDWTSQKKRAKLEMVEDEENLTSYMYMYILPKDCAKTVALSNNGIYLVEGDFLYTDTRDAVLVYIKNYFTGEYKKDEEGVIIEEDYKFYDQPSFDPLLSEYIETVLAAKIILKLTGDANKYTMLYNEARLMENRAIKASVATGHNKDKGNPYWADQLGLPNYGDNY